MGSWSFKYMEEFKPFKFEKIEIDKCMNMVVDRLNSDGECLGIGRRISYSSDKQKMFMFNCYISYEISDNNRVYFFKKKENHNKDLGTAKLANSVDGVMVFYYQDPDATLIDIKHNHSFLNFNLFNLYKAVESIIEYLLIGQYPWKRQSYTD